MENIKKYLLAIIFFCVGTFFCKIEGVKAADINWEGVVIECIYSDGSLFEYSYNEYDGKWVTNKYTYSLKGADTTSSATNSSTNIYSAVSGVPVRDKTLSFNSTVTVKTCYEFLSKGIVASKEENSEGQNTTYIKFAPTDATKNVEFNDADFGESWTDYFWWWQKPSSDAPNNVRQTYELVSENYILTEKAGEPDSVFSYKSDLGSSAQAITQAKYLTILKYNKLYLIQSTSKTNPLNIYYGYMQTPQQILYFNDGDVKTYSGNNGTVSNYFVEVRNSGILDETYEKETENTKKRYEKYNYAGTPPQGDPVDTGELCTKIMPNTAKNLAQIIGLVQLIVPVLLIVLIGFDIGKLVVAGNVDEELPKQKKSIIARFIAALTIFFLPLIIQILLNSVKIDSVSSEKEISAIQYIDCIFKMI